ncbi:Retinol dehydrogenase 11 [Exaiptasia diaphana]|nr:Retinol dehydrogenase 11 [Exaiptasia diaphana]
MSRSVTTGCNIHKHYSLIITGANTGIGKETAVDLAQRGARVIIACRDVHRANLALKDIQDRSGSKQVYFEQLDLASFKSIRDFVERIKKNEPKLHILINNAATAYSPFKTEDGFQMEFGVNHLGPFLLTNLLLDLLKKSAPSRVVNLSSSAHTYSKEFRFEDINNEKTYKPMNAYSQSKLANILFTRELAKRLEGTSVTTYAVHPGIVTTELGRRLPLWQRIIMKSVAWLVAKNPKQGAQTTLYCAVSEELEGVSGKYYSDCAEKQPSDYVKDDHAAKKLWDASVEFVGL